MDLGLDLDTFVSLFGTLGSKINQCELMFQHCVCCGLYIFTAVPVKVVQTSLCTVNKLISYIWLK